MPYEKVQFIAYCINTAPKVEYDKKSKTWKKKYLGLPDTPNKKKIRAKNDIDARVKLISKVIDIAHKNIVKSEGKSKKIEKEKQENPDTLKIFMIPEFFFRGAEGAYELNEYHYLLEKLKDLVEDKKWENWIFVFGTIVAKSLNENPKPSEKAHEAYNVSVVQKGGFGDLDNANSKIIMKEHQSGIDFIKTEEIIEDEKGDSLGVVSERVLHPSKVNQQEKRKEFSENNFSGTSIFEMEGIKFGLEVCLDHDAERLKKSQEYQNGERVDIQLIPSCGMSIKPDAIVVSNGGYIFNCDGILSRKNSNENTGRFIGKTGIIPARKSLYDSHSALLIKQGKSLDKKQNKLVKKVKIDEDISDLYARTSGQLHIYPSLALPSQKASRLSLSQSHFPHTNSQFTTSLSSEPVRLNGMEVIFDQETHVYPVTLQPKNK